ncbi:MAG: hypothetical protein XXXJIFNMEKO3_02322 [Candidatus Erwinia impunctatus]|nr:hypothetical protein XXXJIFNMEKO_02322 [Culicoides impunctatus]
MEQAVILNELVSAFVVESGTERTAPTPVITSPQKVALPLSKPPVSAVSHMDDEWQSF